MLLEVLEAERLDLLEARSDLRVRQQRLAARFAAGLLLRDGVVGLDDARGRLLGLLRALRLVEEVVALVDDVELLVVRLALVRGFRADIFRHQLVDLGLLALPLALERLEVLEDELRVLFRLLHRPLAVVLVRASALLLAVRLGAVVELRDIRNAGAPFSRLADIIEIEGRLDLRVNVLRDVDILAALQEI